MQNKLTWLGVTLILLFINLLGCSVNDSESSDVVTNFTDRTYELNVPQNYDESRSYSLLFVFHGANGSGAGVRGLVQLDSYASWKDIIICYPDAAVENWEEGCKCNKPHRLGIDDVGYVEYLIDKFTGEYNIDTEKIFGVGFSQGGLFAMNLACKLSDRFAGIATVASPMSVPLYNDCSPAENVSVLMIHGTSDGVLPYYGSSQGSFSLVSSPKAAAFWAGRNGCSSNPQTTELVEAGENSIGVKKHEYLSCDPETSVVLFEIVNGGHTWFTGNEFSATNEIAKFFFP